MRAPWTWHTSLDDWSQLDGRAVRRAAVATACYARWLAEADAEDAEGLAEAVVEHAKAAFPEGGDLSPQRRTFFLDRARERAQWTRRLGARRAETLAAGLPALDPASLIGPDDGGEEERRTVPVRAFWGAPTFDGIAMSDRDGFGDPRWNGPYIAACYWADGKRSVAQIAALVRTEFDRPAKDLLRFFRVLARGGLVTLRTQ